MIVSSRFKILIFAHDSSLYGASKSLLSLISYWKKNYPKIDVLVLLPYKGVIIDKLQLAEIDYNVIDFPLVAYKSNYFSIINYIKRIISYYQNEKKAKQVLKNIIKNFNPNVIYTNTSVVSIGYDISKMLNFPFVWHIREFGWKDYRLKYIPALFAHKNKIMRSNTIFVSKVLQKHWINERHATRTQVIYNGFDNSESQLKTTKTLSKDSCSIGILGAIMPSKGQLEAIKAVMILNEKQIPVTLDIYGEFIDEDYKSKVLLLLEKYSEKKEFIRFHGFVDNQKKIYSDISILINCSESEGFGRTIIEAMLEKVPVVANNSGAIPEIIEDNLNGLLYNKTPESLAEKLEYLIKNEVVCTKIVNNGFKYANENHSIKNYATTVLKFLIRCSKYE